MKLYPLPAILRATRLAPHCPDQGSDVMKAVNRLGLPLLAYLWIDVLAYRHVGARARLSWTSHTCRDVEHGSKHSTRTALPPT